MEERTTYLFGRYMNRQATAAERDELLALLKSGVQDQHILSLIDRSYAEFKPEQNPFSEETEAAMLRAIFQARPAPKVRSLWPRIAAAACLLIGICLGGFYFLAQSPVDQSTRIVKNDIAPGHSQATLTLADGKKIVLTKASSGKLASQGSTLIRVNADHEIAYTSAEATKDTQPTYNTLSTKYGEQSPYPLILADGSKVWLNAASSITFPTAFNGDNREVKITGEAYFEVAHNPRMPFRVKTATQEIEVLGTHFNINAYTDEPEVRTTLLEGSVKVVANNGNMVMIAPGEQAALKGNDIQIADADTEVVVAWKNGDFILKGEDFKTVMRQVARWYNVEVVYDPSVSINIVPGGWVSRSKNISAVLRIMELTGKVHFKVEGRRITVTK